MCVRVGYSRGWGAGQRAWETLRVPRSVAPYVCSDRWCIDRPHTQAVVDAEAVEETQRPRQEGRHVNPCVLTGNVGATHGTHTSTDVCAC